MEVKILSDLGFAIRLEVSEADTVSSIKELINLKTGLPVWRMSLFYDNKEVIDLQSVQDCKLRPFSFLQLRLKESSSFSAFPEVGEDSMLLSEGPVPESVHSHISQVTEPDDDIGPEAVIHTDLVWRYIIKQTNRPNLLFNTTSNTLKSLRSHIEEREKIPIEEQVLIFNGKRLSYEGCLTDSGLHNEDTLYLLQQSPHFIVFCRVTDRTISIDCKDSDSVKDLKTRVRQVFPYLGNRVSVFHNARLLTDEATLSEMQIGHETELTFRRISSDIQLFVKTVNGKSLVLDVSPENSVLDLKFRLQEQVGVPTPLQQLQFKGKILIDSTSLCNYGIEQGSTIYMRMRLLSAMQLFINMPNDDKFTVSVENGDVTIGKVKEKIACMGAAVQSQILYFNGYELEDCSSLQDCSITNASVLQLELKLQCRIESEDIIYFRGDEIGTIQELKLRVMSMRGVPPTHQRVMIEGKRLGEETLISSLPRTHSTVISIFFARRLVVRDLAGRIVTLPIFRDDTLMEIQAELNQVVPGLESKPSLHHKGKEIDLSCRSSIEDLKDKAVLCYKGFFNP